MKCVCNLLAPASKLSHWGWSGFRSCSTSLWLGHRLFGFWVLSTLGQVVFNYTLQLVFSKTHRGKFWCNTWPQLILLCCFRWQIPGIPRRNQCLLPKSWNPDYYRAVPIRVFYNSAHPHPTGPQFLSKPETCITICGPCSQHWPICPSSFLSLAFPLWNSQETFLDVSHVILDTHILDFPSCTSKDLLIKPCLVCWPDMNWHLSSVGFGTFLPSGRGTMDPEVMMISMISLPVPRSTLFCLRYLLHRRIWGL